MAASPTWAPRASAYEELPRSLAARWDDFGRWPDRTYFPSLLGMRLEEVRRDYARMAFEFTDDMMQPQGLLHGGAIASLIDTVVVPAIASAYPEPRPFATINLAVRYLSAVTEVGTTVVAEGWIVKRGRSIVFCGAEVATGDGEVIAQGDLVYKVSSPRPAAG